MREIPSSIPSAQDAPPEEHTPDGLGGGWGNPPESLPPQDPSESSASPQSELTPPSPFTPSLDGDTKDSIEWTVGKVFWSLGVFALAGLAEIGGGWLMWQTLREKKPWYYCLAGAIILVAYGVIPTLQPDGASFSRVYAVYGGVFVIMSYGWGWAVDGDKPDKGDWVGAAIALAGVAIAWFWPRGG